MAKGKARRRNKRSIRMVNQNSTHLEMTASVEVQILRFDIAMGNALRVKVCDASEELLEAALDLARAHLALLDGGVEIPTRTVLHHFAPMMLLVLDEVDRLDNVGMVQGRGDTKLGRELFDVFLFCLVLSPLSEFLLAGERRDRHRRSEGSVRGVFLDADQLSSGRVGPY